MINTKQAFQHGLALMAGGVMVLLAAQAPAGDGSEQAAVAAQHAGLASNEAEIGNVHGHLHHAVNCLVGPNGVGFNATAGNPCDGMGEGAIDDTTDAETRSAYENALTQALSGLGSQDVMTAQDAAGRAQETLENAM